MHNFRESHSGKVRRRIFLYINNNENKTMISEVKCNNAFEDILKKCIHWRQRTNPATFQQKNLQGFHGVTIIKSAGEVASLKYIYYV